VLDSVDSTNDEVRRQAARGGPSGLVVVAEQQSAGRGRRGRSWHSPAGTGAYVSVLRRTAAPPAEIPRATLAAAVAACEACREVGRCAVTIQWPNDLVHAGRKLGGILCELRTGAPGTSDLVVGAGVNVLDPPAGFPPEIAARATSLARAAGASMLDREGLIVGYLERLGRAFADLDAQGWPALARRWSELAPTAQGATVRLTLEGAQGNVSGTTAGIDDEGALLVRRVDGSLARVRSVDTVLFEGE